MTVERSVSVIGLGLMGSALAGTFVENGWKTTVWNRSTDKVHPLVAKGAVPAASLTQCVGASRLVVICLLNPGAVHEVLENIDPLSCMGRTLVDYTSGTTLLTRQTQEKAMSLSFSAYIRGAILATPAQVGRPESPFYYAGDEATFRSLEGDIKILGRPSYVGEDPSFASLQGCIMMDAFFGIAIGFLQAVAVLKASTMYSAGGAERFVTEELAPVLSHAYPMVLADLAKQIDKGNYLTGDGMPLSLLIQTLNSMKRTHSDLGISDVMFEPLLKLMHSRAAQGRADEEISSLLELVSHTKSI
ncbi:hypothetical protein BDV33DRAFT_174629 [Aspergillus novoparasiticus]|uniref:Uncharacterized protein n=1 Tax=Aspergillus novoparasiticus TaxID=986946 RepID=A0A5N6EN87_9EURO|nr:hypothetical protein BDV33DRAFT_174629 [Aspergillus novoparasiticus]